MPSLPTEAKNTCERLSEGSSFVNEATAGIAPAGLTRSGTEGWSIRDAFIHRKIVTTLCPVGTDRLTRLMALIAGNKVDLRPLLTHSMKLNETVAGYELFRRREGGVLKIALRP